MTGRRRGAALSNWLGRRLPVPDAWRSAVQANILLHPDGQQLQMGEHSYDAPQLLSFRPHDQQVRVGKYCSISRGAQILTGGYHHAEWVSTYPFRIREGLPGAFLDGQPYSRGPVVIGNDVWVGYGALIMSGVTIGDGAVVAARALVVRDVAPYAVVGGNPAALLRHRFPAHQVQALLELRWWDWDHAKVLDNVDLLCAPSVDALLARHA